MKTHVTGPRLGLLVLILLGLLSAVLRSRSGYILAGGDVFFVEPRPAVVLERDIYLWTDGNAGGVDANAVQLPYRLLWALAGSIGMAPWLFQSLERGLYLVGAGLAMFLLARATWPGRRWAPVLASSFYMFNVARLQMELVVHLEWLYILLPLILGLYIGMTRLLYSGANLPAMRRGLALAALVGLVFPVVVINLPQAIIIAAVITAGAAVSLLLAPRGVRWHVVRANLLVAGLAMLLSAWWLWPTIHYYILSLPHAVVAAVTDPASWSGTQARSSFWNELLLAPQWSWSQDFVAVYDIYQQPLMRILLAVPAVASLAAFGAAHHPAERRVSLVLYAALLLFLFLGKGQHVPASYLNLLAYENVPGFWLLREPWGKIAFFVVLALALLVGLGLDEIILRLSLAIRRPHLAALPAALLLALFPLTMYPLFSRDLLYRASALLPSPQIQIPNYWFESATALSHEPENSRVLLTPSDTFYSVPYTWGGYFADGLADRLLPKSVVSKDYGYIQFNPEYSQLVDRVYQALEDPASTADPTNLLALLNIRYIFSRGDIAELSRPLGGPVPDPRLEVILSRLETMPAMKPYATFGPLKVYRIADEYFLPRIYVPEHLEMLADRALPAAGHLTSSLLLNAYVASSDADRLNLGQLPACQPRLAFEQLNPTQYRIQVNGDCAAYVLAFSSGYDPNWQALILPDNPAPPGAASGLAYWGGRVIDMTGATASAAPLGDLGDLQGGEPVPSTVHIRVNGYANGWLIRHAGPHAIILQYRPQRLFEAGVLISAGTLGVGLLLLVVTTLRLGHSERARR